MDTLYIVKDKNDKIMDLNGRFKYTPERLEADELAYFNTKEEAESWLIEMMETNYKILPLENMFD